MESLPSDILDAIILLLDEGDVLSFTSASRRTHALRTEGFWQRTIVRKNPRREHHPTSGRWSTYAEVLMRHGERAGEFATVNRNWCRVLSRDPDAASWVADRLTKKRLRGLLREGMRDGDFVLLCRRNRRRMDHDDGIFVYSSARHSIVPIEKYKQTSITQLVVPHDKQVIRDLPVSYWNDACKKALHVRVDLTEYADEIASNLSEGRKKIGYRKMSASHFVYRKDYTGHDNRYDIVFRGANVDEVRRALPDILRTKTFGCERSGRLCEDATLFFEVYWILPRR